MIQEERIWTVYVHINKTNYKKYVGITSQKPERRWAKGKGYHKHNIFGKAIEKYGWDNFDHEIIASNLTESEAKQFEITLIRELNTFVGNKQGYNSTLGGDGTLGIIVSEETRKKISKNSSGVNNYWYGKSMPDEIKRKISEANTGREKTQKELEYMSELMSGGGNPSSIKVICDGVEYGCVSECAKHYGVNKDSMRMWLRGDRAMPSRFIDMELNYVDEKLRHGEFKVQKEHGHRSRRIICINTSEVFDSILLAKEKYNAFNIAVCCKGKVKSAGKHPITNEPLKWMYYEEYLRLNEEREAM